MTPEDWDDLQKYAKTHTSAQKLTLGMKTKLQLYTEFVKSETHEDNNWTEAKEQLWDAFLDKKSFRLEISEDIPMALNPYFVSRP